MGHNFFVGLIGLLLPAVVRLVGLTWSVRFVNTRIRKELLDSGGAIIVAGWHHTIIPANWYFRDRRCHVMVSLSSDGDLSARCCSRMGYRVIRGSTSRGGREALGKIVHLCRNGAQTAFFADGPTGPPREPKPGAILAARMARLSVVPMGCTVRGAFRLRSWDRTVIPLPFARIVIGFGEPIEVPREAPLQQKLEEVRDAINRIEEATQRAS